MAVTFNKGSIDFLLCSYGKPKQPQEDLEDLDNAAINFLVNAATQSQTNDCSPSRQPKSALEPINPYQLRNNALKYDEIRELDNLKSNFNTFGHSASQQYNNIINSNIGGNLSSQTAYQCTPHYQDAQAQTTSSNQEPTKRREKYTLAEARKAREDYWSNCVGTPVLQETTGNVTHWLAPSPPPPMASGSFELFPGIEIHPQGCTPPQKPPLTLPNLPGIDSPNVFPPGVELPNTVEEMPNWISSLREKAYCVFLNADDYHRNEKGDNRIGCTFTPLCNKRIKGMGNLRRHLEWHLRRVEEELRTYFDRIEAKKRFDALKLENSKRASISLENGSSPKRQRTDDHIVLPSKPSTEK